MLQTSSSCTQIKAREARKNQARSGSMHEKNIPVPIHIFHRESLVRAEETILDKNKQEHGKIFKIFTENGW